MAMESEKLYMSFQYGMLENDKDCCEDEHDDDDNENATVEFNLLIKWTERLTKEQIQLLKRSRYQQKLIKSSELFQEFSRRKTSTMD